MTGPLNPRLATLLKFTPLIAASVVMAGCASGNNNTRGNQGYYADDRYRSGSNYRERSVSSNEQIYRGRDGRYYCDRSDGTTGLIVGGLAGGVLGNVIAPGGSSTLGTVIGAIGGAVAGNAIENSGNNDVRCR